MANNKCTVHGDPEWEKYAAEQHFVQDDRDEMLDACGNTIKIKKIPELDEMSKKDIKKYKKICKNKIKNGEPLEEHEKDWCDARRDSAEDFSRLDALLFTAMAWILIPAYCFAIP